MVSATLDPAALAIAAAPNGAYKGAADHAALPLTKDAIAAAAAECLDAGAAMLHLHVRRDDGRHTLDPAIYRETLDAIRRRIGDGLLIQVTSEAAGVYTAEQQMAAIRELRPEAVSIALRELIPERDHDAGAAAFLSWLQSERITPQFILYNDEEVRWYLSLIERGVIQQRWFPVLFVLGRYGSAHTSAPQDLVPFLCQYDNLQPWMMCAFGAREFDCAVAAASLGGNVRIGFENNLLLRNGRPAATNGELISQFTNASAALGRQLASADDLRSLWLSGTT